MLDEIKKQLASAKFLVIILSVAISIYLLQILWQVLGVFSDVIVIVISAWLLSFLLEPLVHKLSRGVKIPKIASAFLVYAAFFGLIALTIDLFVPAVSSQLQGLIKILPKYLSFSPALSQMINNSALSVVGNSIPILPSVAQFLFYLFIVLIISFYFVIDKDKIIEEFFKLLPRRWHNYAHYLMGVTDDIFGSFFRVQLLFGVISGVATWLTLRLAGVDFAASTGLIAGILTVIPMIGPILAIIPPVAIAFLVDPARGIFVFVILFLMQQVVFNIIGPKMLGKALKLHPVFVLLSFIVGFKLFGIIGGFFAIPALAVLIIAVQEFAKRFYNAEK